MAMRSGLAAFCNRGRQARSRSGALLIEQYLTTESCPRRKVIRAYSSARMRPSKMARLAANWGSHQKPFRAYRAYRAFSYKKPNLPPDRARLAAGRSPTTSKNSNFTQIYEIARPGLAVAHRKRLPAPKAGNSTHRHIENREIYPVL